MGLAELGDAYRRATDRPRSTAPPPPGSRRSSSFDDDNRCDRLHTSLSSPRPVETVRFRHRRIGLPLQPTGSAALLEWNNTSGDLCRRRLPGHAYARRHGRASPRGLTPRARIAFLAARATGLVFRACLAPFPVTSNRAKVWIADVLVGEPVSIPDQVGGRLSPGHATGRSKPFSANTAGKHCWKKLTKKKRAAPRTARWFRDIAHPRGTTPRTTLWSCRPGLLPLPQSSVGLGRWCVDLDHFRHENDDGACVIVRS